ncbi:alcohol dehydrogenase catalytic domain-containing protein [Paraburkholderia silvatlantica]|uniref:alcohol dehydrogenase catalytic domain-containing protein n=1 Tax=Paraburkholderia silvatlantica TaxID=321895 RepID=UPI003751ADA3
MHAAIFEKLGQPLRVERVDDPEPDPDGVVLRVSHCGICGSDLHMTDDAAFGLCEGDIIGHEFSGEVVATGREVKTLRVGHRVSVVPYRTCGRCAACLAGDPAWCAQMELAGGGYGEYAAVSARQCVTLPVDASFADGALVEPLAVALHGIAKAGLRPGQDVLILGAGPIGLATAFWAARFGARRIVVQDVRPTQEARAMEMGATAFVCGREDPVGDARRALGGAADVVFECAGVPGLIAQSVEVLKPRGTLLLLGLCTQADSFVPFAALSKELRIQTSAFFDQREYEAALDVLASGAAEPRLLVSAEVGLVELPSMFEQLKRSSPHCKVMIQHADPHTLAHRNPT